MSLAFACLAWSLSIENIETFLVPPFFTPQIPAKSRSVKTSRLCEASVFGSPRLSGCRERRALVKRRAPWPPCGAHGGELLHFFLPREKTATVLYYCIIVCTVVIKICQDVHQIARIRGVCCSELQAKEAAREWQQAPFGWGTELITTILLLHAP